MMLFDSGVERHVNKVSMSTRSSQAFLLIKYGRTSFKKRFLYLVFLLHMSSFTFDHTLVRRPSLFVASYHILKIAFSDKIHLHLVTRLEWEIC